MKEAGYPLSKPSLFDLIEIAHYGLLFSRDPSSVVIQPLDSCRRSIPAGAQPLPEPITG